MTVFSHIFQGLRDLSNAATRPHADLRRRLTSAAALTVVITLIATLMLYLVERHHSASDIKGLWDSFYFTVAQMTTISAPMSNPVTGAGQLIVLMIDIYAITVVATLAGMFGAFFHQHSQHLAADGKTADTDD